MIPERKPLWLKARIPGGEDYARVKDIVRSHQLHTVCESANCPNQGECWAQGTATVMILGDTCTRACAFCNVKTGMPRAVDPMEPQLLQSDRRGEPRPTKAESPRQGGVRGFCDDIPAFLRRPVVVPA